MPRQHTLKTAEIFSSIQGEGLRSGDPTIFIRLSGCNLRCSFCDTQYAWEEGKTLSVSRIMSRVSKISSTFPAEWVCLTGGEPLMQDISALVEAMKKHAFFVQVETNATFFQRIPVDWYTISPKPDAYFYRPEYRKLAKEVKLVVTEDLNAAVIKRLRGDFPLKVPIFLQPESNSKKSQRLGMKLLVRCLQEGMTNIRLGVQLHKIYKMK